MFHLLIKLEDYLIGHSKVKSDAANKLLAPTFQGLQCAVELVIQRLERISMWQRAIPPICVASK
jgi:hypothetical protein